MKTLLLSLLICFTISLQAQTLKEKYVETKSHYTELANQTGFTFEVGTGFRDRYKRQPYFTNWVTIQNGSQEVNKFLATVINENASILVTKVKQLAQSKRTALKTRYDSEQTAYEKAITDGTDIPDDFEKTTYELRQVYNSYNPIKNLTTFEVQDTHEGLIIKKGFSVFNDLIVQVLNNNLDLIIPKYKQAVHQDFIEKKVALRLEATNLVTEIDK